MLRFLIAGLCLLSFSGFAQSPLNPNNSVPQVAPALNIAVPMQKAVDPAAQSVAAQSQQMQAPPPTPAPAAPIPTETIVGVTTYDLQTNSSVQNRIVNHGNGKIACAWTYSESYDLAANDRGTGYNFYDGTNWMPNPTARLENVRTGWPSLVGSSSVGELAFTHAVTEQPTFVDRPGVGSGVWTTNTASGLNSLWNRTVLGGTNGTTLHNITLTTPVGNGGSLYQGLDGAIIYSRSTDMGATWSTFQTILPGLTSAEYTGFGGDGMHMAEPRGNTIAFGVFDQWQDVVLMKSTDNGLNWTKTTIIDFPLDLYEANGSGNISDVNGDGVADTLDTNDDSGWVLLDNNGMAHVFTGYMRVLDDDPANGGASFFPATNGLLYWNESFGAAPPVMIAGAVDIDGNGLIDLVNNDIAAIGTYFTSLSSHPSAGIAANGNMYVAYMALMENLDQSVQNYRHINVICSTDGGCSWSEPIDIQDGQFFSEGAFASVADLVDNDIHLIYQRDDEPGLSVRGDEDPYRLHDMVYVSMPVSDFAFTPINNCVTYIHSESTGICAGDTVELSAATCGTAFSWSTGETSQTIDVLTAGTYTVTITTPCGTSVEEVTLGGAPTPSVTIQGATTVCLTEILTANDVNGSTYLWSTGETTQDIVISNPGTYTVTVTNCSGSVTDSHTLTAEPVASAIVTTPNGTTACDANGGVVLQLAGNNSYQWSNGATAATLNLTMASQSGVYTVTATNSCGDIDISAPIAVSIYENTTFVLNATDAACGAADGSATVTIVSGTNPHSFLWNNLGTSASISNLSPGTYTVTVSNSSNGVCPDYAQSVTVTGGSTPIPSTVSTVDATCFNSTDGSGTVDATGSTAPYTYAWANGDTGPTSTNLSAGANVVTVTDDVGCSTTHTVTVGAPAAITTNVVTVDADCGGSNGAASLFPTGGAGNFSYFWSNGSPNQTATGLSAGIYTVTVSDMDNCTTTASATVNTNGSLSSSIGFMEDISCLGACDGIATVTAGGGTTPLTYLWDDPAGQTIVTATGLCEGTFNVTVTDATGCLAISSVTMTDPAGMTLSTTSADESCGTSNGVVSANAAGGSGNFTYAWSNGGTTQAITGLPAGTYTVTVTDSTGCSSVNTTTITNENNLSATTGSSNPACGTSNGTATAVLNGGNNPSYLWSDALGQTTQTATGLGAGSYTVTITDGSGCSTTANVTLNDAGAGTVTTVVNDASCPGIADGTASALIANGTSPFTYLWSNGQNSSIAIDLVADIYVCTVTDAAGCVAIQSATVSEPAAMVISTSTVADTTNTCIGFGLITIDSGGTAPFAFLWSDPFAQTTAIASGLCVGTYSVTVTDNDGCSTIQSVTISNTNGVAAPVAAAAELRVYPNPASEQLTVLWTGAPNDNGRILLMNSVGQLVRQQRVSTGDVSARINVADLPKGVYWLRYEATGHSVSRAVIVQ